MTNTVITNRAGEHIIIADQDIPNVVIATTQGPPGSGGGGGTGDHSLLTNRTLANSHPATAVSYSPTGDMVATTVQAAITELDNEKSATTHTHTGVYEPANANIQSHISSTTNPHSVTASQVGSYTSGQVDTLLTGYSVTSHNHTGTYEPANANIQSHISSTSNPHSVTAAQTGAYTSGQVDTLLTGYSVTSHTHSLDNLSDVVISTPAVDQILKYNGVEWVNSEPSSISPGSGISLYLDGTASDIVGYFSLNEFPTSGVEVGDTVAVTSGGGAVLIETYATDSAGLGGTTIEGGVWEFNTYAAVDSNTGVSTVRIDAYKRTSGGTETLLFSVNTPELVGTVAALYTITSVQTSFAINSTDRLVLKYYGETTSVTSRNITVYHNGIEHYSHLHTPLVVRHNDIAGLQGGSASERYHLTLAQHTDVANATNLNTASTVVKRDASGNFSAGTISAALSGNSTTATSLATGRTIGMTGDVSWISASFDGSGNVTGTSTIGSGVVTYAKMQNVSATDKLLGRVTAGPGSVEEISCTAAGRAILDDATAADQATTLGLGTGDSPTFAGASIGPAAASSGTNNPELSLLFVSGDQPNITVYSTNQLTTSSGTEKIGELQFVGRNNTNYSIAARLRARQSGTWSTVTSNNAASAMEVWLQDNTGTPVTAPVFTWDWRGSVSIGPSVPPANVCVSMNKNILGGVDVSGYHSSGVIQSGVTSSAAIFKSVPSTAAASFTLPNLYHFHGSQSTIGSGSTVTSQMVFYADSTITGASNNYGFYGNIAASSGRWNFYAGGTAANYFNGVTTFGTSFGYGTKTGVGGAVTQLTSKSTGVTLNTICGAITTNNAALGAGAYVSFTVTNSTIAETDVVICNIKSGGTANAYHAFVTAVAAGSFTITLQNITAGSLSEAPVINFAIIKAVAS